MNSMNGAYTSARAPTYAAASPYAATPRVVQAPLSIGGSLNGAIRAQTAGSAISWQPNRAQSINAAVGTSITAASITGRSVSPIQTRAAAPVSARPIQTGVVQPASSRVTVSGPQPWTTSNTTSNQLGYSLATSASYATSPGYASLSTSPGYNIPSVSTSVPAAAPVSVRAAQPRYIEGLASQTNLSSFADTPAVRYRNAVNEGVGAYRTAQPPRTIGLSPAIQGVEMFRSVPTTTPVAAAVRELPLQVGVLVSSGMPMSANIVTAAPAVSRDIITAAPAAALQTFAVQTKAAPAPWRLKLGAEVPNFSCSTTKGDFKFHEFVEGGPQYTMLFSHPKDFTPVCTTELGRCEVLVNEFGSRGVQLIGVSCDSLDQHQGWTKDILTRELQQNPDMVQREDGQLSFPIIADSDREIVTTLGMLDPEEKDAAGVPLPARALMIIDQAKKVKLAIVYPATTGRNFEELLRVIDAIKLTFDLSLATPADWRQGDRCIVAPNVTTEDAAQRFEDLVVEDLPSGKQYLRHVKCPASEQEAPPVGILAGQGFSVAEATGDAVMEAVQMAIEQAQIREPQICFAACTADRDVSEVQAAFAELLPNVPIHGLTSSGAVLHSQGSLPKGIGCLLIEATPASFATAFSEDAEQAAQILKEQMPQPQAILMSTVPGSEEAAIAQITAVFGDAIVPIFGGTAADNEVKGDWRVFCSQGVSDKGISLVGINQGVRFGAHIGAPYTPTEQTAIITKCEGRRAFEIDGAPASDWVYNWLGESVEDAYVNGGLILQQTAQRPIGFQMPSGEYLTAHIAALGGPDKTVDFFVPIMEGDKIVVMDSADGPETGYAQCLADSWDTAMASGGLTRPQAGLLIYCGGMAIAVDDKMDDGLQSGLQGRVGDMPLLGMTCFGEQAYLAQDQKSEQRNLSLGFILFE